MRTLQPDLPEEKPEMTLFRLIVLVAGLGVVAAGLSPCAPNPARFRSLQEDHVLLSQKDGSTWKAKPVTVTRNKQTKTITPELIFVKEVGNFKIMFKGHKEFLAKPGFKGLFSLGIREGDRVVYSIDYYRLEERGNRRLIVFPDRAGGEIIFTYELDRQTLRLKDGKEMICGIVDTLSIAREYRLRP